MALVIAPVIALDVATPRTRLLTIDVRDCGLLFEAGHALMVGVRGQPERRPYSIACSPERMRETGHIELLAATDAEGRFGPHLSGVGPGTILDLEGPHGTFRLPPVPPRRLLLVAGGTGIAPLRAMLDHALRARPSYPIALLYSARRADEFAFIDELLEHVRMGRLVLHQTVTREDNTSWDGSRGRIGRSHFDAVLSEAEAAETLCLVCGPPALVSESAAMLRTLGVPPEQIRSEGWGR